MEWHRAMCALCRLKHCAAAAGNAGSSRAGLGFTKGALKNLIFNPDDNFFSAFGAHRQLLAFSLSQM